MGLTAACVSLFAGVIYALADQVLLRGVRVSTLCPYGISHGGPNVVEAIAMIVAAAAAWLALELGALVLFYWPGWIALRMVTLGRYPPPRPISHNHSFVSMAGAVTVVLLGLLLTTML